MINTVCLGRGLGLGMQLSFSGKSNQKLLNVGGTLGATREGGREEADWETEADSPGNRRSQTTFAFSIGDHYNVSFIS